MDIQLLSLLNLSKTHPKHALTSVILEYTRFSKLGKYRIKRHNAEINVNFYPYYTSFYIHILL